MTSGANWWQTSRLPKKESSTVKLHSSAPGESEPPLAPPEWTMKVERNDSGYYVAILSCRGESRCRISLNAEFESHEAAERALAVKAREWVADYLSREQGRG